MTTTISDEQALLPCPFCGEMPEVTKHFREDLYGLIHRCRIAGPIIYSHGDRDWNIKRWNTRAPDPRVVELVAACRNMADVAENMTGEPDADAAVWSDADERFRAALAAMENDTTQCHWCGSDPRATCHVCKRG